jgi:nicotinic acid mononucleotide adenylyltransferase
MEPWKKAKPVMTATARIQMAALRIAKKQPVVTVLFEPTSRTPMIETMKTVRMKTSLMMMPAPLIAF